MPDGSARNGVSSGQLLRQVEASRIIGIPAFKILCKRLRTGDSVFDSMFFICAVFHMS